MNTNTCCGERETPAVCGLQLFACESLTESQRLCCVKVRSTRVDRIFVAGSRSYPEELSPMRVTTGPGARAAEVPRRQTAPRPPGAGALPGRRRPPARHRDAPRPGSTRRVRVSGARAVRPGASSLLVLALFFAAGNGEYSKKFGVEHKKCNWLQDSFSCPCIVVRSKFLRSV